MQTFEIFFSDLNEDAQRRLLKAVGAETPADMNWDIDMCPIAMYDFETETNNNFNKGNIRFEWDNSHADIGNYTCYLFENDKKINDICFTDYTSEYHQKSDKENGFTRCYSFEVDWCHGWSMHEGFDYDANYNNHTDENNKLLGSYQGNCTHTVEDIKKWCENWLAQRYLASYYNTIAELDQKKARAEWFESQGFKLEENIDN